MDIKSPGKSVSRLAESSYLSPYSHTGTPAADHAGEPDPYKPLRAQALAKLEAMGYDPATMVERGVVWAEDQDPFGHVKQSQYTQFFGTCFHRVMESYDQYLIEQEYDDMIHARTVIPVVRKYELSLRRQVKYPDSLIPAHRQDQIEPTRNNGTTSLYSLRQQTIVAEVKGSTTYVDVKSGRPIDIRTVGGNWPVLYDGFVKKSADARAKKEKWDKEQAEFQPKPRTYSRM